MRNTDHPRSRGVYPGRIDRPARRGGSSPLARGLPGQPVNWVNDRGIIPARAGFTRAARCARGRGGDHPRSRGVYSMVWNGVVSPIGSSPLARGLLADLRESCQRTVDHPRSRGVYATAPAVLALVTGSSPLARGLPLPVHGEKLLPGIIPARAGFTGAAPSSAPAPPDHPRSRGVYCTQWAAQGHRDGSSPLARGLHADGKVIGCDGRIIPARAGFTSTSST